MHRLIVTAFAFLPLIPQAALAGRTVTFEVPGAVNGLAARSINDSGEVAGFYIDGGHAEHGFIRARNGNITTFDVIGNTIVQSISRNGSTTGWSDAGAFLRAANGSEVTFNVPGHRTGAVGINDNGEIAGSYETDDYLDHGFVRMKNGRLETFDSHESQPPLGTVPQGINDNGDVVGVSIDRRGVEVGFVRKLNKTMVTIRVPHASVTDALAINDLGAVVGVCQLENDSDYHGFVRDATGAFTTFDGEEDARVTQPNDINNDGTIVGYYVDRSGQEHGFVRYTDGEITLIKLPKTVSNVEVESINSKGAVTGDFVDQQGIFHGFIREP